ncbi:MAG: hypothetical protein V1860_01360 [bacterium]
MKKKKSYILFFVLSILMCSTVQAIEKIEHDKTNDAVHIITKITEICDLDGNVIAKGDRLFGCKLDVYSAHSDIPLAEDVMIGICGKMEFSIPRAQLPFKRERHYYCKKKGCGKELHGVPVLDYLKNPYVISQCSTNGWVARKTYKGDPMPHNMILLGEEYYLPSLLKVPDLHTDGTKVPWYMNDPEFWERWNKSVSAPSCGIKKKDP